MARIHARFHLPQHSLPGKTQVFFFPHHGRFFRAQPGMRFLGCFVGLGLLRFHRFAFPSSSHEVIIVPELMIDEKNDFSQSGQDFTKSEQNWVRGPAVLTRWV
jgi:hypothetical protein